MRDFNASCQRGHELITFTGPESVPAFEAHMREAHGAKPGGHVVRIGQGHASRFYSVPTYLNGKAYPWVAPKPQAPAVFARTLAEWERMGALVVESEQDVA